MTSSCTSKNTKSSDSTTLNEDEAVKKLATDIYSKYEILKDKRIGAFDFSTLDGKDIPEGKRLSNKLLETLIKKSGLKFVERSEIDKILEAQGIEQTGIIDTETIKESGKVLSIDVMINGTIARVNNHGELSVKVVDITTGEIYIASSTDFFPEKSFSFKKNPVILNPHRKSPEKVETINRTFFILDRLSRERPLIFLLSVLDRYDMENIARDNPRLAQAIKKTRQRLPQKEPQLDRRITQLKDELKLAKDIYPERYKALMNRKAEIVNKRDISHPTHHPSLPRPPRRPLPPRLR